MRNLNQQELVLVAGAATDVVINISTPPHYSDAYIAGMKGEPMPAGGHGVPVFFGMMLGIPFAAGGPGAAGFGFLVGYAFGSLLDSAFISSDYHYGKNFAVAHNFING